MSGPKRQPFIVGIDLGTTNSLIAVIDERGPQVLDVGGDGADGAILPSVVAVDPRTGGTTVGTQARRHAVERPTTTVFSIKRLMGRSLADVRGDLAYLPYAVVRKVGEAGSELAAVGIGQRVLTPPQISALILKELKARAERRLGCPVRQAVITVPAYFDDAQRQATRDAGRIAGLEVVRMVNEPTAAALAYGLDRLESGHIAVYDWGGGTFDVSILRVSGGVFEVLSTHGDTHLGGDDFDRRIVELVQREVRESFGLTIESPRTLQVLRDFAEAVRVRLSTEERAALEIDLGGGQRFERTITREELESLIAPLVERTVASCRQALRDAGLSAGQIGEVVLVGGATRTPLVRRRVAELFGRTPYTALDPMRVVALGAAVQASILAGASRDLLLLDVTPLSLGIETMGGAMGKLILRNTRIPCQAREMFTTFVDGQTSVKINVLQGERELAGDCRSLGEFDLRNIPPMPAGIPKIEVSFLIDHNGILNVAAKELRSGREASVQIIPAHGLTADEVRRMEEESYAFARQDMTAHRLIDLRNQAAFDTHKTEQMLAKVGGALEAGERERIEAAAGELRRMAETCDDPDLIYEKLKEFDRMTVRLAELGVAQALRSGS